MREKLVSLEIPFVQHTCNRGSSKRQLLADKYGKFAVPYLEVRILLLRLTYMMKHGLVPMACCMYVMQSNGLSQTLIASERALFPLRNAEARKSAAFDQYGWAASGNWGDTLVTAIYPPNLHKKLASEQSVEPFFAASSLHPGGLNGLFGDGSVRFIRETISTWTFDPVSGEPQGARTDSLGAWINLPRPGVWQSLTTRADGETLSADSY